MAIRILLTHDVGDHRETKEETPTVHYSHKDSLTIGSDKECDIFLQNGGNVQVVISREASSSFSLRKESGNVPVKVNGEETGNESVPIKNGDTIRIGPYQLRFTIEFDRVGQHRNAGWIATLSAILILAILVFEAGVMVALPKLMAKRQLWGLEVMRQRTLELLDAMRSRCDRYSGPGYDNREGETVRLIHEELDNLAVYLRKSMSELNQEEVTAIHQDISHFEQILDDLETGILFPEKETIDTDYYIQQIILDSAVAE